MRFPIVFSAIAIAALVGSPLRGSATDEGAGAAHQVLEVSSGDTIVVEGTGTVGLLGVDAPDPAKGERPAQPFATEATEATKSLVLGKRVLLEAVPEKKDALGRTLACVILEGGAFLNAEIVKKGLARVEGEMPEGPRRNALLEAEKEAREKKLGIWAVAKETKWVWVTKNGEAYHLESCRFVDTKTAEKISVEEATKRGYRPCKVCRPDVPVLDREEHPDTVYVTKTGTKFHRKGCIHLRKSAIPISREEAIRRKYEPCKTCKP